MQDSAQQPAHCRQLDIVQQMLNTLLLMHYRQCCCSCTTDIVQQMLNTLLLMPPYTLYAGLCTAAAALSSA